MPNRMTKQDRMWTLEFFRVWWSWTTPYICIIFDRYWRISYGIGPFYGSVGYVQLF